MNWKLTILLVMAAIAVGVVVYINPFKNREEKAPESPWFYQVAMDDITNIGITFQDKHASFYKTEVGTWAFDDPKGIPPAHERWGGITLLLSGPQTRRDLTEIRPIIEDPAQYGLDNPHTIVDVGLTASRAIQFRLGDKTTDGGHHYAQVIGFPQLFIIAASWGDVVARLATEPPLPKWYVKRDESAISELNIYLGNPAKEQTPALRFAQDEEGKWSVMQLDKDEEGREIDPARWATLNPMVVGPPNISVAIPLVDDQDYSPWGITPDSKAIEIRFTGKTDRGTRYTDGILLRIGSKMPDGSGYYGKNESDQVREPVLFLDATWIDTFLGLYDNVPYAAEPQAAAGSTP